MIWTSSENRNSKYLGKMLLNGVVVYRAHTIYAEISGASDIEVTIQTTLEDTLLHKIKSGSI